LHNHSLVSTTAGKFQEDHHLCVHHHFAVYLTSQWKWRREAGVHTVTHTKQWSTLTGNAM